MGKGTERAETAALAREPFPWNRIVGYVLIAIAVAAMFDPDYPIARDPLGHSSANSVEHLAPVGIQPVGDVTRSELRFEWEWPEPAAEFRLVVLDVDFHEVAVVESVTGNEMAAPADLRSRLAVGETYHWQVERIDRPQKRSAPVLWRLRDDRTQSVPSQDRR